MSKSPFKLTLLPQTQHHELMLTKIDVPRLHGGLVHRTRVMDVFDHAFKPGCSLVLAPAGSGKTLAVSQWLHHRRHPVAWFTLDKHDNEPHRFWSYLIASLDRVVPGIQEEMFQKLNASYGGDKESFVMSLINELMRQQKPITIVLDDIHFLEQEKLFTELSKVFKQVQDPLRLILVGRNESHKPSKIPDEFVSFNRIGMDTLAFDQREVDQFMQLHKIYLEDNMLEKVHSKTEGWAVGLALAVQAMGEGNPNDALERILQESDGLLNTYLAKEVFSAWPEDIQQFLLKTSILNRLTPGLCNAVTGRKDSLGVLRLLAKERAFVACLNHRKGWYRYHKMLTSFLRLHLYKEQRSEVPGLYLRAGDYFLENVVQHEAVECYLKGRHYEKAAALIDETAPEMLKGGRHGHTLSRWLRALPDSIVQSRYRLLLAKGWAELLEGRHVNVGKIVGVAEKTCIQQNKGLNNPHWPQSAVTETRLLEANLAKMEKRYAVAAGLMAGIVKMKNFETVFPDITRALFSGGTEHSLLTSIHGFQGRVSLLWQDGEWLPIGMKRFFGDPGGGLKILMAEIHYERNEMDPAVKLLMEGLNEAEANEIWEIYIPAIFLLARVMVAQGDLAGALQTACEAKEKALKAQQSLCLLKALQARLGLLAGKGEVVAEWKEQCQLSVCSSPDESHLYEQMTRLRILISQKKYSEASLELSRLLDFTGKHQCLMNHVEIKTLLAMCQYHHGNQEEAMRSIEEALVMGQQEGYRRIFMDEGAQILPLLKAYRSRFMREEPLSPIKHEYLEEIIQGTRQFIKTLSQNNSDPTKKKTNLEQIETLTPKETLMLQCLSQRMTNQEIADQLGITVSTVKVHTRNIYSKLFVTNRTQAVDAARNLGLL